MGGRGASSASSRRQRSSNSAPVSFNRMDLEDFQITHRPQDFVGDAPETVRIGGVSFRRTSEQSITQNGQRFYYTSYQTDRQNKRGEYPFLQVIVGERRRGSSRSYQWDSRMDLF